MQIRAEKSTWRSGSTPRVRRRPVEQASLNADDGAGEECSAQVTLSLNAEMEEAMEKLAEVLEGEDLDAIDAAIEEAVARAWPRRRSRKPGRRTRSSSGSSGAAGSAGAAARAARAGPAGTAYRTRSAPSNQTY